MATSPLVLLVDDEPSFQKIFLECLTQEIEQGLIQARAVSNAQQGLEIINENLTKGNPILPFIDIILPDMSGEKLVSQIKVDTTPATKTEGVLISAHKKLVELEEIQQQHNWITSCWCKPLKRQVIKEIIRKFLNKSALSQFDYDNFDRETASLLIEETDKIRAIMKKTVENIIEIGGRLYKVKAKLEYGLFKQWIETELSLDYTTANNFMRVFDTFNNRKEEIAKLGLNVSVLYLMSARNTPEAFREEVFRRAEAGYPLSHAEAKQLKKEYLERSQTDKSVTTIEASVSTELEEKASQPSARQDSPPKKPTKRQEIVGVVRQQKVWQLGSHLLYCGFANSPEFRDFVASLTISFNIGFPNFADWTQENLFPVKARSTLVYNTLISNVDLTSLLTMVQLSIEFSTEEKDKLIFSFLPYPELLLLSDKLVCDCFIAEPDPAKCQAIVARWQQFAVDKKFPFFDSQS